MSGSMQETGNQHQHGHGGRPNPYASYPPPRQVPTFQVEVTSHTGALIFWFNQRRTVIDTYDQCAKALRSAQTHNLILGWWSFLSLVLINWVALLQNMQARRQLDKDVQNAQAYAQWWHRYVAADYHAAAQPAVALSVEAANIVDQLIDHHRDGEWPTGIGWYLPIEQPPWAALEELRRLGHCTVTQDGQTVAIDFTDAGRQAHLHYTPGQ